TCFCLRFKFNRKTHPMYMQLVQAQGGEFCAICKKLPSEVMGIICIDHDHKTGLIRGLLCNSCNSKLAAVEAIGATHPYLENPPALKLCLLYRRIIGRKPFAR